MIKLDEDFWTERYRQGYTGWDIGYPSTPIVQYLDQIQNKNCRIAQITPIFPMLKFSTKIFFSIKENMIW